MIRTKKYPLIFVLAIFSTGCRKSADARLELAQMNIPFIEIAFIVTARQGNASVLPLFLDAKMSTDIKTCDGQPALSVAAFLSDWLVITFASSLCLTCLPWLAQSLSRSRLTSLEGEK
jgi:hypothetical protein